MTFKTVLLESGAVRFVDEDGDVLMNEDSVKEAVWEQLSMERIGRKLMERDELSNDMDVIKNIRTVIAYCFAEEQELIRANETAVLRLALKDTEDELSEGMEAI